MVDIAPTLHKIVPNAIPIDGLFITVATFLLSPPETRLRNAAIVGGVHWALHSSECNYTHLGVKVVEKVSRRDVYNGPPVKAMISIKPQDIPKYGRSAGNASKSGGRTVPTSRGMSRRSRRRGPVY